ncbi:UNVERIFIED_CONTAM: hypothetical protein FKN15_067160 [Acipenser sinensis]
MPSNTTVHKLGEKQTGNEKSACLTACLPPYLPASLPACLSVCLPAYLPASLPACLTACLPACLPVHLCVRVALVGDVEREKLTVERGEKQTHLHALQAALDRNGPGVAEPEQEFGCRGTAAGEDKRAAEIRRKRRRRRRRERERRRRGGKERQRREKVNKHDHDS